MAFVFAPREARAQSVDYELVPYGPRNGLPASEIITLFQDAAHYIWIGHIAGLSRYDGYAFENFFTDGHQRLGKVHSITQDALGYIWIGADGGLFRYSAHTIRHIPFDKPVPVYKIVADTTGGIWIGTSDGPAYLSATATQSAGEQYPVPITRGIFPPWKKAFPGINMAKDMVIGADTTLYFSDGYAVYHYRDGNFSMLFAGTKWDYVTGMALQGKDSLYFTTLQGGLHTWEHGRHGLTFPDSSGNAHQLLQKNGILYYFAIKGVYTYQPSQHHWQLLTAVPPAYQKWVSCLLPDDEHNCWIGTHEQLLYARRKLFHTITAAQPEGLDELYSIRQLRDGTLLAGGNKGRLFRSDGSFQFKAWTNAFERSEVTSLYETSDGDLWISSGYQGISWLHNNKLRTFTTKDGLRDNTNHKLISTSRGQLFAAGDDGISEIIREPAGDVHFKNYRFTTGSSDYPVFRNGIELPGGGLLLACDRGLYTLVNDSIRRITLHRTTLQNFSVTDVQKDNRGHIWVSTAGDGILLCTMRQDSLFLIKQLTEADGLSSTVYLQLLADKDQVIWAVNYHSLTRIEMDQQGQFFIASFSQPAGYLKDNYHDAELMQDNKGLIWIATSSGLMYFDPALASRFIAAPVVSCTRVTALDQHQDLAAWATGVDSLTGMPLQLQLPYTINGLTFHFNGIHLSDPGSVRYAYRLLGTDSMWTDAGSSRSISFRNLAPGTYTFEVKATSGSNTWSNTAACSFTILPPFWIRWWFIVLCILSLTALLYSLIRWRIRNIKEKEAQKTALQKLIAVSYQYQLETEQVINYFATSMSDQKTVDDMLWDIARNCISRLGFEDCIIYLLDKPNQLLIQKAAWGPKTIEGNKIINPIEIPVGKGIVGSVALSGKAEIINDTSQDLRYIVDDARRYSEITVPIINHGKVIGIIDSEHSDKGFYTERHLQILTTIASLIAEKLYKMKAQQAVREREIELITLNRDLATSQLTALRAQMSPHFIFNALNSIQQYILQGHVNEANKYLSKFSRLQREILHHCDQNFITLEKEIEMLQLYLELEQLRFLDHFEYQITLADHIDSNEIRIPPMILQPFVENAIWHGLMPKAGPRHVHISFSLHTDSLLNCTIRDNGIGRTASARLKEENGHTADHKSKGLMLVNQRLQILQQQYLEPFEAFISDITDPNGAVTGTQVKLILFIGH